MLSQSQLEYALASAVSQNTSPLVVTAEPNSAPLASNVEYQDCIFRLDHNKGFEHCTLFALQAGNYLGSRNSQLSALPISHNVILTIDCIFVAFFYDKDNEMQDHIVEIYLTSIFAVLGPYGERDDQQVFVQKVVPETDQVFVRLASNGKRCVNPQTVEFLG